MAVAWSVAPPVRPKEQQRAYRGGRESDTRLRPANDGTPLMATGEARTGYPPVHHDGLSRQDAGDGAKSKRLTDPIGSRPGGASMPELMAHASRINGGGGRRVRPQAGVRPEEASSAVT
jgi:hypothetical protein